MGDYRKSVTGYIVEMGGAPICWSSKQQAIIAQSSCEAEYIALGYTARQVLWLRNFAAELGFPQPGASFVACDNRGAIYSSRDPKSHSRLKHIDIRLHFIRYCVNERLIDVHHIPGVHNVADVCTKPLEHHVHSRWMGLLGLHAGPGGVLDGEPGVQLG